MSPHRCSDFTQYGSLPSVLGGNRNQSRFEDPVKTTGLKLNGLNSNGRLPKPAESKPIHPLESPSQCHQARASMASSTAACSTIFQPELSETQDMFNTSSIWKLVMHP